MSTAGHHLGSTPKKNKFAGCGTPLVGRAPIAGICKSPKQDQVNLSTPIAAVGLAMFGLLVVYEVSKQLLLPAIAIWESHLITIVFGTAAAMIVSHFVLRKLVSLRILNEQQSLLRESEKELADFFDNSVIALHWTGPDGIIMRANQAELDLLGYDRNEYVGRPVADFHVDQNVADEIRRCKNAGEALRNFEARLRCKDGSIKHVLIDSNVKWENGKFAHTRTFTRDISERKRIEKELCTAQENLESKIEQRTEELLHRAKLAQLAADIGVSLARGHELRASLRVCAECLVRHLDAAFARIWTLHENENVLELQASAGIYSHIDGPHKRVPVGQYKIGLIAQERRPHLTNSVIGDPRVHDQEWAKREGLVAFAGYPLIVDDRVVGVMALFARKKLPETTLQVMASVANQIALGIERKRTDLSLRQEREFVRLVLDTDPNLVFVKDAGGRYVMANKALANLYGTAPEGLIGRCFDEDLAAPAEVNKYRSAEREVLRNGRRVAFDETNTRADGTQRCFHSIMVPLSMPDGTTHVLGIASDITERKKAEQSLQASEQRYRTLFEDNPQPMWVYDMESLAFLAVNDAAIAHYGYNREEFLAMTIKDIRPREHIEALLEDVLQTTGSMGTKGVWQHRKKDEAVIDVEITSHILLFGERPARLVLANDITARLRAEATRDRLIAILEATTDLVAICQVDGPISYINAAGRKLLGLDADEQIQLSDFRPEESRAFILEKAIPATVRDGVWSGETELRTKTRGIIPVSQVIIAHKTPSGDVEFLSTIVRDISDRKQAEEAVRAAQQRMQHVVASSPAVLYTLAVRGKELRHVWTSENIKQMLGYSVEECCSVDWWRANVHPEDLQRLEKMELPALCADGHVANEYRFRHRDGSFRWIRSEMRLLRDEAGDPSEVIGSWSNITDWKQLEEQYRQAQKMEAVGKLAGGVAHDFNNLLCVINGYSEMLLHQPRVDETAKNLLREILKAGERATGLTRQLLAFGRKQMLQPKLLDLNAVLGEMEKMLCRMIGEDIELTVAPSSDLAVVLADPVQIDQVIMNLAVNARDAMPKGGKLTIETSNRLLDRDYAGTHPNIKPGNFVRLAVSDTGCGMDKATQSRIFEPFFTTKEQGKGTGLGLATVYGIVKQSDGHIEVYSEVGVGSTFKIYLPAAGPTLTPGRPRSSDFILPQGKETVLLVEDEEGVRAFAKLALRDCGYRVLEAEDGRRALEIATAAQEPIDLVITDVVMPRMSGREVAERLMATNPGVKVLYVSGYTDDAVVRHGIVSAEHDFLQKPFTPAELANKVRQLLDK